MLTDQLANLLRDVRACRLCVTHPAGRPLPHEPRPVVRASSTARLAIYGQAPGSRVHASGVPFLDPSGDRLRAWMGIDRATFYDEHTVAIVPMGFCFPGQNAKGADLPPRRECAPAWRERILAMMPRLQLALLIGSYAQRWHLPAQRQARLTATVADWRQHLESAGPITWLPLPHPSWRNNAWIKNNPWFEAELLPVLQREVARVLEQPAFNRNRNDPD